MGIGIGNAQIHSDRAGGAGGGAPTGATYLVVSLDATLTAERTLVGEAGVITTSDAGAGLNFTVGIATQGVGTAKIADNAVTYAKLQDVSAGSRLLGRFATTSGDVQEILVGTNLTLTTDGTLNAAAGSIALSTGQRLLGRFATTSGPSQEITVSGGLQLTTDGTLQIATQGVLTSHVADAAVTYVKIQNVSAGGRFLGRSATVSGVVQEMTVHESLRTIMKNHRNAITAFTDCMGAFTTGSTGANTGESESDFRYLDTDLGRLTFPTNGDTVLSAQHPGIGIIFSSITTSGGAMIRTNLGAFVTVGGLRFEAMFNPSTLIGTATGGGFTRIGFHDSETGADSTDGMYLELTPSGGVFGKTARGGIRTTSPLIASIAAGAWTRGLIEVNAVATTGVVFTLFNDSGTQLGQQTVTDNIPQTTTEVFAAGVIATRDASGLIQLTAIDYVGVWTDSGLTRGGT